MNEVKIINLPVERWSEYKELKLNALKLEPYAFSHTFNERKDMEDAFWKDELIKGDKQREDLFFAEINGKIVGMAGYRFHTLTKLKHNAFLTELFVLKEFRGRGIGKILMEKRIEEISKNKQVKNIICEIISTQIASIELHKKYGFEIIGELKDLFNVDGKFVSEMYLEKRLL